MRDEFCYLNRRAHAYDYKIVDYDKRNMKKRIRSRLLNSVV